ncbi:MAG: RdgB/HAM1 family non-canonical purine NTP pyrophosphatase [Eggerthellales bacterium]|nr:RdgB/HAM1 family non-canonical purine NTP pyrophosphatase [Eggerthellales bacterium]
MKTIVLATNNAHKVREIEGALAMEGWEFKTLRQMGLVSDPTEDADSFVGNARIKARAAHEVSGGLAALADDSGIMVDALGGRPGVYSARYAGEQCDDDANNAKMLAELEGTPWEQRTGRYVCALVFVDEDGSELVAEGTVEGKIGFDLQGEGGFGYDPMFYPDAYDGKLTFAQVSQEDKAVISHRGVALRKLAEMIAAKQAK